jgi:D-glycero-alpha-D-manno-heptose-7-phosphate kinase
MIITQTPLRVSFAGGGTDLPSFYRRFGGAVVSTAIDKFVYINVNQKFDERIRVSYSKTEEVDSVEQINHKIVRAALTSMSLRGGLEITSIADVPSSGTGLGSSSSFTVGLLLALNAFVSRYVSPGELAAEACRVELDLCGEKIGKQDQYAAAYGGLNFIRFEPDETVIVEPILCSGEDLERLESHLVTFYTGKTRPASSILVEQSDRSESHAGTQNLLRRMTELAYLLRQELSSGNIDALGPILDEGWDLKREMHQNISDSGIDDWYRAARAAGASGGKLMGAGGGGFLMFFAPPQRHDAIERALGLRRFEIGLERGGSRVLLYHKPRLRRGLALL